MKRSSGILAAVSSLPSPYGIGTFGKKAYEFADFLADSGQKYWQMLPLGPTSYGDSPYQSFSSYAGNPYYLDLDMLIEDGLLVKEEVLASDWGTDPNRVDYAKIYEHRFPMLEKAKRRGWERDRESVMRFEEENASWLPDYTLFMACKRHFGMKAWSEWPDEGIRMRTPEAVERYKWELREDIELFTYIQYLFFLQWEKLRKYLKEKGISVIGDVPIYVAMDSADTWSEKQFFEMNEQGIPDSVSGVPPDYFTADGQLWGNPLYRWDKMEEDGFGWWIRRIGGASRLFDVIRIDHFRGFDAYWAVPSGEKTARNGKWRKGPGIKIVSALNGWFKETEFIAEDLGFMTESVKALQEKSGWPGMKILQFAFDSREPSDYLPHKYTENCICYTGTHDNATLQTWLHEASPDDLETAIKYLGLNAQEGYENGLIRGGMSSVAKLFVAQIQDYLPNGVTRMNTPGKAEGNWQYRIPDGMLTKELSSRIHEITKRYGRC